MLVALIAEGRMTGMALAYAVGAGALSSPVPYATDLLVLRTVPPHLFGVLMRAQPGLAALAGIVLLGQIPQAHEWSGIAVVAAANVAAITGAGAGRGVVGRRAAARPAAPKLATSERPGWSRRQ